MGEPVHSSESDNEEVILGVDRVYDGVNPLFLVRLTATEDAEDELETLSFCGTNYRIFRSTPVFEGVKQYGGGLLAWGSEGLYQVELVFPDSASLESASVSELFLSPIYPGRKAPDVESLLEVAGNAYFVATYLIHGREIWQTDGTVAGTFVAHDLNPGPYHSNPGTLQVAGPRLITTIDGPNGRQLIGIELLPSAGELDVAQIIPALMASFELEQTGGVAVPLGWDVRWASAEKSAEVARVVYGRSWDKLDPQVDGVAIEPGDVWTLRVRPLYQGGRMGPEAVATFTIQGDGSVGFSGWVFT